MLLTKYLTAELRELLATRKTPHGVTLSLIESSGMQNPDAKIGAYAGDAESYESEYFGPLFEKIIEEYHGFGVNNTHHSDLTVSDINSMPNLDPRGNRIISTRIRVARNLAGFAFTPAISREDRLAVEERIVIVLRSLENDLAGTYHPLATLSEEVRKRLVEEHLLFRDDDKHVRDAGIYRDWPEARGVFLSEDRCFGVWVNEEDLRIFSLESGADLRNVFDRLSRAVTAIESKISFARHHRYGYLTSCPTNVGTGMRASVLIRLPALAEDEPGLKERCLSMNLQARGMHGEHSERGEGGIYDISNRQRLGKSEAELIEILYEGVRELIKLEEGQKA